jgi:ribonuclease HI
MTKGEAFILYSDGASRGNPGNGGGGAVLYDGSGAVIATVKRYLGVCTNNEAEYRALMLGLEEAVKRGIKNLKIFLDSELLVRQIAGIYRVKNHNLQGLMYEVRKLLSLLDTYTVEHVMREKNRVADSLANEAIDEALRSNG